jgi:phage terminase small subunit
LPTTNADGTKPEGGEWSPFGRQEVAPPAPEDLSALTPLDFLLQVMRDPEEDKGRRMNAAQLAAPYVHAKKGETSAKKDDAEKRKQAAQTGRFGRREAPKLATAGGKPV